MIVVQISGGIGNQLFQYCYALNLKKLNPNREIYIENGFYDFQPQFLDKRKYELNDFENLKLELIKDDFFIKLQSFNSSLIKSLWYLTRIIFMPSKSYFIKKNNSGYINNIISKFYKKIYLIGDWQDKKFNLQEYINIISHLKLKKEIPDEALYNDDFTSSLLFPSDDTIPRPVITTLLII